MKLIKNKENRYRKKRKVKRAEVKSPEKPDLSVDQGKNGAAGCVSSVFFLGGLIWIIGAILWKSYILIFISIPFFVIGGLCSKVTAQNTEILKWLAVINT